MNSQSKLAGHFSFLLSPAGIVTGYLLTLFAIVGGAVASPFSSVWIGLLSFVVGVFFVVAIPVIVTVWLFLIAALYQALTVLGRRLLFAAGDCSELQRTSKPVFMQMNLAPQGTDTELWDRWIDGYW
jgi:hypothetical protein